MSFASEYTSFVEEMDSHYAAYPTDLSSVEAELHELSAMHPEWLPYTRKAAGYRILAERCPAKIFRHFPFYFELDVGKPRTHLGSGADVAAGVGTWMKREPFGAQMNAAGSAWWETCRNTGLSIGWSVLDDNHHGLGYDNVFRWGLGGLIQQAQVRLRESATEKERAFLEATIAGNQALIIVAQRLADEASRLASEETDPATRRRLERIAATARRVPEQAPGNFYEALNTILFMREVTQSVEGNGISVFGHVDRLLWPYYRDDLAAGRTTREDAKDLLGYFLAFSDVRFGMRRSGNHVGTNTTVGIGGCDAKGACVFNDITRMIVEVYLESRLVDPKLNARVSSQHPGEYLELLAALIASGNKSLCIYNDDVVIEANVKMGKAREDCRLYVGGGCQENVLENTEINSRATMYLNLAQVFLMGFFPDEWSAFTKREDLKLATYEDCAGFEDLYEAFLRNLEAVVDAHIDQRNRTEAEGLRYNPCPMHSSTMSDCIAKGLDMMEGGARYSFGSISLTGIGTLIDSLFAVSKAVYEESQVPLAQLKGMLETDFEGEEAYRQYLRHRVPKFGQDGADIRAFSARVFSDVARVSSGRSNSRGGRYEASLFAFRSFANLGAQTGATPDGRRASEHLSPGMSPSPIALGKACSIGQVLSSLEPLDLTLFPVVAVLDVKLPASSTYRPDLLVPVIRRFVACGGSVLQVNAVDPEALLEAREHPERHPDLVVRVSGYSAYFSTLPPAVQDEVIERTLVRT